MRNANALSFFDYLKYKYYCKKNIKGPRYKHSLAVGKMFYNLMPNLNKWLCFSLGLAHDFAHEWQRCENVKIIKDNNILLLDGEENTAKVLHSPVGAALFRKRFPFLDEKYYQALRFHTIICKNLDEVALNFFVADKIDKTRRHIKKDFRKQVLAEKNSEKRVLMVLDMQERYFSREGLSMLKDTFEYYNLLKEKYVEF